MRELEIPQRAYHAAGRAAALDALLDAAVEAAAPLIVAAKLRRKAANFEATGKVQPDRREVWIAAANDLIADADELDPEGRTR